MSGVDGCRVLVLLFTIAGVLGLVITLLAMQSYSTSWKRNSELEDL